MLYYRTAVPLSKQSTAIRTICCTALNTTYRYQNDLLYRTQYNLPLSERSIVPHTIQSTALRTICYTTLNTIYRYQNDLLYHTKYNLPL